mmetsp:Transcript_3791/g.11242  ORF Transcript_3791/g.11242 Transcript_3791/m.11242 type:complete len:108 (-) Transcript_3791:854-1177(-)
MGSVTLAKWTAWVIEFDRGRVALWQRQHGHEAKQFYDIFELLERVKAGEMQAMDLAIIQSAEMIVCSPPCPDFSVGGGQRGTDGSSGTFQKEGGNDGSSSFSSSQWP